ncbi:MAG: tRNA (adenosine(37)-N6)-threonylcarbamoyltransferase complex ATPase subunit type 1 TsaE [Bacteroidota bacterium]
MELIIQKVEELEPVAQQLLNYAKNRNILTFIGEIGAGKTTLIQQICQQLGVEEAVTSPTFSIVNEYTNAQGDAIFHIDLYRLKSEEEAIHIGIEEYLDQADYCFIEWPQIIENLLPEDVLRISLETLEDSSRKIVFL